MADEASKVSEEAEASAEGGKKVSRRNLLRSLMWSSVGAVFLEQSAASLAMFWPLKVTGFGGKVVAGNVEDFAVNSVTKVREGKFYVVRLPEGFMALYWKCVHLGCTVPWSPPEDPGVFHCPCHGSIYDITGKRIAGPAPRSLDYMNIEIVEGKVVVDTGKITTRFTFDPKQVTKV